MNYYNKWLQFVWERFNPIVYLLLIFSFIGAHYGIYISYTSPTHLMPIYYYLPLLLGVLLFFFKLRLYDEIKDFEYDKNFYPDRPLPRNLLNKNDLLKVIFFIIIIEILIFSLYGIYALIAIVVSIGYSLLMFKEFFISKLLRSSLLFYALTHTLVVIFISFTVFLCFFKKIDGFPFHLIYFVFGNWFIFNIFEFTRKIFLKAEEKKGIDSYSKIYGKIGSVFLVLSSVLFSAYLINISINVSIKNFLLFYILIIYIFGLQVIFSKKSIWLKIFKITSYIYIFMIYFTIIFTQIR